MARMRTKLETMAAALEAIERGVLLVDAAGHVWSLVDRSGKTTTARPMPIRVERKMPNGYLVVHFWLDGRQYMVLAHRLVWTVLRGPIPDGMDINHQDGIKSNNAPANLEVVTRSRNLKHARETGLRASPNVARDLGISARELRATGLSYAEIGRALGVSQTTAFRAVSATPA
jgi:hypothetical protein